MTQNYRQKTVTVLGATGSIGLSTLDIIRRTPDRFKIDCLTANSNVERLAALAKEFAASVAVIGDETLYSDLKHALSGTNVACAAGADALVEAASRPTDLVMGAIVGAAGLRPIMAAVHRGATVALANKESLVCAGDLMTAEVKRHGATLLPVDSEHNAIFQVFDFDQSGQVDKIILTASGGPFRQATLDFMKKVTPEQAVAHPNWDMGAKISVDSATMMNKGLEVIEAYHLFPIEKDQIEVLVHPQSVVHSLVAYNDGSMLAQLGSPDMRTPISYSLAWPERMSVPVEKLDLAKVAQLTFEAPDYERFPCLKLAREALQNGGGTYNIECFQRDCSTTFSRW